MLFKHFKSTEFDSKTCRHVPEEYLWPSDSRLLVKIQKGIVLCKGVRYTCSSFESLSNIVKYTPGLIQFGTCICSNVENIHSWTYHVYWPFEFLTSLGIFYTFILPLNYMMFLLVLYSFLFWGSVLLYLRSPKGDCCSISDDLSCFWLAQSKDRS